MLSCHEGGLIGPMVELARDTLHTSVTDPVAASMNFLNEVASRFPAAISLAAGRPFDEFYEVTDIERYLAGAKELGVTIRRAIDTHLHNDFVSGCRELAAEWRLRFDLRASLRLFEPQLRFAKGPHLLAKPNEQAAAFRRIFPVRFGRLALY